MQVGGQALAFFFLQFDGGIQQDLLLFLFHLVDLVLEFQNPALVQDDKDHQGYHQDNHTDGTQEEDQGNSGFGGLKKEHR